MDVSNKFLVILLVITIVITLIGTWYSIDRLNKLKFITAQDVFGFVNITISNQTTINVTATNCAFGTGYVTSPYSYAVIYPGNSTGLCTGSDGADNWTATMGFSPDCMEVRNDGNIDIRLEVSSSKDAATMIGGTGPSVKAWSLNKEASSCNGGGSVPKVDFPGVEMDTSNQTMCSCLHPDNASDELYVGCQLTIPDNAYGVKGDVWTFWAAASSGFDCIGMG